MTFADATAVLPEVLTVERVSSIGLLLAAIWAYHTGRIVPGWALKREQERGDKWEKVAWESRSIAADAERTAQTAVKLAKQVTEAPHRRRES